MNSLIFLVFTRHNLTDLAYVLTFYCFSAISCKILCQLMCAISCMKLNMNHHLWDKLIRIILHVHLFYSVQSRKKANKKTSVH